MAVKIVSPDIVHKSDVGGVKLGLKTPGQVGKADDNILETIDVSNLEELLLKLSAFVEQNPEVKELDLNPIFVYRDGAIAVDTRVILEEPLQ